MAEGSGGEKASSSAPDVFISYASPEVAIADAVVASLESHGLRCCIAPTDVTPGAFYAAELVRALNDTRILVLGLTEFGQLTPE